MPVPVGSEDLFLFFRDNERTDTLHTLASLAIRLADFLLVVEGAITRYLPIAEHSSNIAIAFDLLDVQAKLV